ncbi:MAG: TadE/TadG family type IV pilus assembly protein [Aminipila sp.]
MKSNFYKNQKGQAAAETALVFPIILLLIMGILTLGVMTYTKSLVVLASSQGAKVGSYAYGQYLEGEITYDEFSQKVRNTAKSFINNGITGGDTTIVTITISDEETEISVKVKYTFTLILPLLGDVLKDKTSIPIAYESKYLIQ